LGRKMYFAASQIAIPMKLLLLALAPVIIIAIYIYYRDRYEKEPLMLLLKSLGTGILITVPILLAERGLSFLDPYLPKELKAFYTAFIVAGITEETFKFLAFYLLIWNNRNFNEKFDGIVYAVYISLGFAAIENILYVFQLGETTGYVRALVSVPGHALFGVTMGYYFGLAKFYTKKRKVFMLRAILYPVVLHGIFDFILMSGNYRLLMAFIPYVIILYIDGLRRMKNLSSRSIFRK
jgi:RsiW-degrading membrane proteinase PrsW (M82 family)